MIIVSNLLTHLIYSNCLLWIEILSIAMYVTRGVPII